MVGTNAEPQIVNNLTGRAVVLLDDGVPVEQHIRNENQTTYWSVLVFLFPLLDSFVLYKKNNFKFSLMVG